VVAERGDEVLSYKKGESEKSDRRTEYRDEATKTPSLTMHKPKLI
jgi:hypothetical protein